MRKSALLTALLLCSTSAFSADVSEKAKSLDFKLYLETVTSNMPEIKANGIDLLTQINALKSARSLSDISLTSSGAYSSSSQVLAYLGNEAGNSISSELTAGLAKKFTSTGTDVQVDLGYSRSGMEGFSAFESRNTYTPAVGITVKQPILYNFLGKIDRFTENNTAMQVEIEKVKILESNKSTLNSYKKLYFQWIFFIKQLDNTEKELANSIIQRSQVKRNYQNGLADEDDYQKTAATVLEYQRSLEDNRASLNNLINSLYVYLGSRDISPSDTEFDEWYQKAYTSEYSIIGFEQTTTAKILSLALEQLRYSKGVYENRLLPELNITAGVTQKNLSGSKDDAFSDLPYRDWNLGFEFEYKLGNNEAESGLDSVNIQLKSLQYEKEAAVNTYTKTVLTLSESARALKQMIDKKTEYLNTLNRQLAAEKRKYSRGRLNLSYLIQTQNSIASAKTEIVKLKYQLITNYIDYIDTVI